MPVGQEGRDQAGQHQQPDGERPEGVGQEGHHAADGRDHGPRGAQDHLADGGAHVAEALEEVGDAAQQHHVVVHLDHAVNVVELERVQLVAALDLAVVQEARVGELLARVHLEGQELAVLEQRQVQ
ncbi:hypothetical protein EG864_14960, partial [Enterococcus faecalis]